MVKTKRGVYLDEMDIERLNYICEVDDRKTSSAICTSIKTYYTQLKGKNE